MADPGSGDSGPPSNLIAPLSPEQLALLPHQDLGASLVAIIWVLLGLATTFLTLRVYCKLSRNGRLWWDDAILIASWLCLLVSVCLTTFLVSLGFGRHIWDFPVENFPRFTLPISVRGTLSITALAWSKTAFGVTLLRLTNGWMHRIVWFIIISINLSFFFSAALPWVQCKPLAAAWDLNVKGECWDRNVIYHYNLFSGAYSGAMDFALALLPWKLLMGLRMRRKEKIGAAVAMSMGVLAGIAAIMKTAMLPGLYSSDLYDSVQLLIWDTAEAAITIVAASVPVLRVLIRDSHSTKSQPANPSGHNSSSRFQVSRFVSQLSKAEGSRDQLGSSRGHNSQGQIDSRSDKSILGEMIQPSHDGGIVRTHTILVEFDKRQSRDDIEMGRMQMR